MKPITFNGKKLRPVRIYRGNIFKHLNPYNVLIYKKKYKSYELPRLSRITPEVFGGICNSAASTNEKLRSSLQSPERM